jgi:hypothetical protein
MRFTAAAIRCGHVCITSTLEQRRVRSLYHVRSNAESTNAMIKTKFGGADSQSQRRPHRLTNCFAKCCVTISASRSRRIMNSVLSRRLGRGEERRLLIVRQIAAQFCRAYAHCARLPVANWPRGVRTLA